MIWYGQVTEDAVFIALVSKYLLLHIMSKINDEVGKNSLLKRFRNWLVKRGTMNIYVSSQLTNNYFRVKFWKKMEANILFFKLFFQFHRVKKNFQNFFSWNWFVFLDLSLSKEADIRFNSSFSKSWRKLQCLNLDCKLSNVIYCCVFVGKFKQARAADFFSVRTWYTWVAIVSSPPAFVTQTTTFFSSISQSYFF